MHRVQVIKYIGSDRTGYINFIRWWKMENCEKQNSSLIQKVFFLLMFGNILCNIHVFVLSTMYEPPIGKINWETSTSRHWSWVADMEYFTPSGLRYLCSLFSADVRVSRRAQFISVSVRVQNISFVGWGHRSLLLNKSCFVEWIAIPSA